MTTDKDVVFRHRATGVRCRIESKNVKLLTQSANRQKYMVQIDKMAAEFEKTGELQAWVNHEKVDPSLRTYGESRGVPVFEKVNTGEKALQQALIKGTPHFEQVLADFDARAKAAQLLTREVRPSQLHQFSSAGTTEARKVMVLASERNYLSQLAPTMNSSADLAPAMKWIGKTGKYGGAALIVGTEGYMIWQYTHAAMTQRQFVKAQIGLGVGLAAAIPGAEAGAYVGSFTGPGAPVCIPLFACIGGLATGIAGTMAADAVVDHVYEKLALDPKQRMEVDQFVHAYYAAGG